MSSERNFLEKLYKNETTLSWILCSHKFETKRKINHRIWLLLIHLINQMSNQFFFIYASHSPFGGLIKWSAKLVECWRLLSSCVCYMPFSYLNFQWNTLAIATFSLVHDKNNGTIWININFSHIKSFFTCFRNCLFESLIQINYGQLNIATRIILRWNETHIYTTPWPDLIKNDL